MKYREFEWLAKSVAATAVRLSPSSFITWLLAVPISAVTSFLTVSAMGGMVSGIARHDHVGGSYALFQLVIAMMLGGLGSILGNVGRGRCQLALSTFFSVEVLKISAGMNLAAFEDPNSHDEIQRASREASAAPGKYLEGIISLSSSLAAMFGALLQLSHWGTWTVFAVLLGQFPAILLRWTYARNSFAVEFDRIRERRYAAYLQQLVLSRQCYPEIRQRGLGPILVSKFQKSLRGFETTDASLLRKFAGRQAFTNCVSAMVFIVLVIAAYRNAIELNDPGALSGFVAAMLAVTESVEEGADALGSYVGQRLAVKTIFSLLQCEPVSTNEIGRDFPSAPCIEFDDVTFYYPGTSVPALKNTSFFLSAGLISCFQGSNGSGKSTIVKLILGFYQPNSGRILINGVELSEYNLADMWRKTACVMQDQTRFEDSLLFNVTVDFQSPDASRARKALDEVGLMKQGWIDKEISSIQIGRTIVDGDELSGGEWQRISLARALYLDPSLVILDEPTSAADVQFERHVSSNLRQWFPKATIIIVTHRVKLLESADRILVMSELSGQDIEDHS